MRVSKISKLKALNDFVIVKVRGVHESVGAAKDMYEDVMEGVVFSVGPDAGGNLKERDIVLYQKQAYDLMGTGLCAVPDDCIIAILDGVLESGVEDFGCTPERLEIYNQVDDERLYQTAKWDGAKFDDTQTEANWVEFIKEYSSGDGRGAKHDFRTRLLKVAALAVAAIEICDRKETASAVSL